MSTHDTYLLCWATAITEDVVNPLLGGRLSECVRIALVRIAIVLIASFLLTWSLWYELGQDLWDYMTVTGAIYFTGALAVLALGLYWKRASTAGAYLALGSGALMLLGLEPLKAPLLALVCRGGPGTLRHAFESLLRPQVLGLCVVAAAFAFMVLGSLLVPGRRAAAGRGGRS